MARPTIYGEVADRIRQAILLYRDGWEIPSVRSLVRIHGVASDTVRKALHVLVNRGEIEPRGPACRYIRRRSRDSLVFCKPYPAVAVAAYRALPFGTSNYLGLLLAGLCTGLRDNHLPLTILSGPANLDVSPLPGGLAVQPSGHCFSAIVFVCGAPSATLAAMVRTGAVVMSLDCIADVDGVDSAAVDCEAEAHAAVEHLAQRGHRRIAFLAPQYASGPAHWALGVDPDAERFSQAMLRTKRTMGLDVSPALHRYYVADASEHDGVQLAVEALWRLGEPPTALVSFSPNIVPWVLECLGPRGLRYPADLSIVTRDCMSSEQPAYTTLASDPMAMGITAAEHIKERLTDSQCLPRVLQFPTRLIHVPSTSPVTSLVR
jgi:hypothetical protein